MYIRGDVSLFLFLLFLIRKSAKVSLGDDENVTKFR